MAWQFNPYAVILLILVIPLAITGQIAWRHRQTLAGRFFLYGVLMTGGLAISYAGELFSADLTLIRFWLNFQYVFHANVIFYAAFALAYAGFADWVKPLPLASLFVLPVFVWLMVWTNEAHGLIWAYTGTQEVNGLILFDRTYGPMFWVWTGYLWAISIIGVLALVRVVRRKRGIFRRQALLVLLGFSFPWAAVVLTVTRTTPVPLLDLVPFGAALQSLPIAVALFNYRFLEVLPIAYRKIAQEMTDLLIVYDDGDRIIEANPAACAFFSLTAEQMLGASLYDVAPQLVIDKKLPLSHPVRVVEFPGVPPRILEVRYMSAAYPHDRKQYVMIGRDVTVERQAEANRILLQIEQQRANMLADFVQNISHDFRTRFSLLASNAYMMRRLLERGADRVKTLETRHHDDLDSPDIRSMADLLDRAYERMVDAEGHALQLSRIIDNMLFVTHLNQSSAANFAAHDLHEILYAEVRHLRPAALKKQHLLSIMVDETIGPVLIDRAQIAWALGHLLENAIQFTPPGGTIDVVLRRAEAFALIEVRDSGIGISPEDLPHIFERFFRADRARQIESGGAGLGLAIVKQIVEPHNGTVEVQSVLGKGSVFRLRLPLQPVAAVEQAVIHP